MFLPIAEMKWGDANKKLSRNIRKKMDTFVLTSPRRMVYAGCTFTPNAKALNPLPGTKGIIIALFTIIIAPELIMNK